MARDPESRRIPELHPVAEPLERPRAEVGAAELARTLAASWRLVAKVAGGMVALAVVYVVLAKPVYTSEAVIQIDDKAPALSGLEDLSTLDQPTPAEAEIEVIRSRALLRGVVEQLGLDVDARPRRFPLVGALAARWYGGREPAPARLGLSSFGWGGERIRIDRLVVPADLRGVELRLAALEGGRFRLWSEDGTPLEGQVGDLAAGVSPDGPVSLLVSELVARPGTTFLVEVRDRDDAVSSLREALRAEERGKKSGIVVVSLEGDEPARVAEVLDAVAAAYVRHHVDRKTSQAAKTLEFLETQLPGLKKNLADAEAALNEFQRRKGTVNSSRETEAMLNRSVDLERTLLELQLQEADLRHRFTANHPTLASVTEKIGRLRAQRAAVDVHMRELPQTELDSARLLRDVKVASELYFLLLNKAQEMRIMRSAAIGNASIVDGAAIAREPSRPKRALVLAVALLLGLGAGIAVALLRKELHEGLDDPHEVEARTGIPVYATIPHSDLEQELERAARHAPRAFRRSLVEADAGDPAVEALRSLRTALQFALGSSRGNVVALGAPSPCVGKTFVCANLAQLFAAAGRRVLLVDADLRRGRLHRYFEMERQPGLADAIHGVELEHAIRATRVPRLDLLSAGRIPRDPAELLAGEAFRLMLAALSKRYDLVILDTPPVLAVTDTALVARHADVNLLVLGAGANATREVSLALKSLSQTGVKILGAILNDLRGGGGRYGQRGRYYRYVYRSEGDGG